MVYPNKVSHSVDISVEISSNHAQPLQVIILLKPAMKKLRHQRCAPGILFKNTKRA